MNIFIFTDYKSIIRDLIQKKSQIAKSFNLTKLAAVCGIQKTYLSKVLNHNSHLNSDQLHLACEYFCLKKKEISYIFLLFESERTGLVHRKEFLLKEARKISSKELSSENYLSVEMINPDEVDFKKYHLDPLVQLVHMFLTIPKFAKNHNLIANELSFKKGQIDSYLELLLKLKLIVRETNQWKVIRESIHLSKDEIVCHSYRILLRTMVFEKLIRINDDQDYIFSVLFTADESTRKIVHKKFLEFLNVIQPIIKNAPAEKVYQLNFDLLDWSK